ncbi:MAG: GyrI-like domain-containing protein [Chloroflexales bacterium]|nr:GyrI-like domain-containing protein [Chloroflexales bacterium]
MGHFTAILHDDSFDIEDTDVELGFLLDQASEKRITLPSSREMKVRQLPATPTAVTAIRLGIYINNHLTYGAIGAWIESNGYCFAGPPREVFIVLPSPGREDEAVVEVQFPVVKQSEAKLALITQTPG